MPWVQLRFAEYHFNIWKIKKLARPVGKMISAVDASPFETLEAVRVHWSPLDLIFHQDFIPFFFFFLYSSFYRFIDYLFIPLPAPVIVTSTGTSCSSSAYLQSNV